MSTKYVARFSFATKQILMAAAVAAFITCNAPVTVAGPVISAELLPAVKVDMVMLIEDIPGDSAQLKNAIDIDSYSHGISLPIEMGGGAGGGGSAEQPDFSAITITKHIDRATPLLMKACASGKHFANVTIYGRRVQSIDGKPGESQYMILTLEDVMVSSCQMTSDTNGQGFGQEQVSLVFGKITESMVGKGDPVTFEWDLRQVMAE